MIFFGKPVSTSSSENRFPLFRIMPLMIATDRIYARAIDHPSLRAYSDQPEWPWESVERKAHAPNTKTGFGFGHHPRQAGTADSRRQGPNVQPTARWWRNRFTCRLCRTHA